MNLRKKIRLNLAILLMKLAGKSDSRFVELACFNYVTQNYDDFQDWAYHQLRDKAYE